MNDLGLPKMPAVVTITVGKRFFSTTDGGRRTKWKAADVSSAGKNGH